MRWAHPNLLLTPYKHKPTYLRTAEKQHSIVSIFLSQHKAQRKNKSNTIKKISKILMLRAKSFQACMFLYQLLAQGPIFQNLYSSPLNLSPKYPKLGIQKMHNFWLCIAKFLVFAAFWALRTACEGKQKGFYKCLNRGGQWRIRKSG